MTDRRHLQGGSRTNTRTPGVHLYDQPSRVYSKTRRRDLRRSQSQGRYTNERPNRWLVMDVEQNDPWRGDCFRRDYGGCGEGIYLG